MIVSEPCLQGTPCYSLIFFISIPATKEPASLHASDYPRVFCPHPLPFTSSGNSAKCHPDRTLWFIGNNSFLNLLFSGVNSPTHDFVYSSEKRSSNIISQVVLYIFTPCKNFTLSELFLLHSINLLLSMFQTCYFKRQSNNSFKLKLFPFK